MLFINLLSLKYESLSRHLGIQPSPHESKNLSNNVYYISV